MFVFGGFTSVFVFCHLYLYFSPVFALEIRGSVCEHFPGTKGPSARHHPQEAGGERNQSNQIPNSNWIKRKTLLVHFLISGYLSTPLCHENQVYKHFPFDYIPSPYLGGSLRRSRELAKGEMCIPTAPPTNCNFFGKNIFHPDRDILGPSAKLTHFFARLPRFVGISNLINASWLPAEAAIISFALRGGF